MSTIRIDESVRNELRNMKRHSRETYSDVILRLLDDHQKLSDETRRDIQMALEKGSAKSKTE
ncbi:MAG: antitoxin VapB family protein [Thermoplasmata archaeon]